MTATELLQVQSARYVPVLVLVIAGVNDAVGVLWQTFQAYKVRLLDKLTIAVSERQAKFSKLCVLFEFAIIAVAVGVMQGYVMAPVRGRMERKRQKVMILIEVICRFIPERTVTHRVTSCLIVAISILNEGAVSIGLQVFVELVELT